jgi:polyferredoxin
MDACDSVMGKIGKPKGLIRYSSMHADRVGRGGEKLSLKRSIFRARPVLYFSVLLTLLFGFGWVLSKRQPLDLEFIRATGSPFEEVHQAGAPREITNRFNVDLHNLTFEARRITLAADGLFPGGEIVSPNLPLTLAAGEQRRIVVFFRFPQSLLVAGGKNLKLTVRSRGTDELEVAQSVEVRFVGPY